MEIIKADVLGFCKGVENALKIVRRTKERYIDRVIKIYGEIAHNRAVIDKIESYGILTVHSIKEIESNDIVIIRAHGISDAEREELLMKKCNLIDATCPLVLLNQKKMRSAEKPVLLFGIRNHSETRAVEGSARGEYKIVSSVDELKDIDKEKEYEVVMQTTFESLRAKEMFSFLDEKGVVYTVKSTVCHASQKRREALKKLSEVSDLIIVIGDKSSANTNALKIEAESYGVKSYLIEKEDEITEELLEGVNVLGVSAGSSAPSFQIEKIISRAREIKDRKEKVNAVK